MIKPLLLSAAALMLATGPAGAQQSLERPGSAFVPQDNPGNWQTTITRTARGHQIGNPEAEAQVIEFVSYTCGHCANFTANGEPALELAGLAPGKVRLEVRPVIRNALDLTLSLLAACGDPSGFKGRHRALMLSQDEWMGKARSAPQSQQAVWGRADKASRMNAASALGLTAMLEARGQSRSELDACVTDDAAAKALLANGEADYTEFSVSATPSFALDGKLLNEVHSWDALYPVLNARLNPGAPG
jgi:protein-disulfide isomerase